MPGGRPPKEEADARLKDVTHEERALARTAGWSIATLRKNREFFKKETAIISRWFSRGAMPDISDDELYAKAGLDFTMVMGTITVSQWIFFLLEYQRCGVLLDACATSGVPAGRASMRASVDRDFNELMQTCRRTLLHRLEQAGASRAIDGVERSVYFQGAVCGSYREYSDKLLAYMHTNLKQDDMGAGLGCVVQANKAKKQGNLEFNVTFDADETRIAVEEATSEIYNKLLGAADAEALIESEKTVADVDGTETMNGEEEDDD